MVATNARYREESFAPPTELLNSAGAKRKEKNMAKCRHRVFEIYEFRDEATSALTRKTTHATTEVANKASRTYQHLAVSQSKSVTHIEFKRAEGVGDNDVSELREDFSRLADELVRDSRVVFDFAGSGSFGVAAFDALVLFSRKLRRKGSRIVLCRLDPAVHPVFLATDGALDFAQNKGAIHHPRRNIRGCNNTADD